MANWRHEEVALMGQITVEMRALFDIHDRIKVLLPSLESYSDPIVHMERNDLAEEGGALDQSMKRVLDDLDRLIEMQEGKRKMLGGSMIRSFDSLKFFVLYMGIALVVIGAIAAFFIVRGIVTPVQRLRSVLLSLGRGVFPRTKVRTTNDEIGDMSNDRLFQCCSGWGLLCRVPADERRGYAWSCVVEDAR
jgi:methyl-accepting chemotaxis protein